MSRPYGVALLIAGVDENGPCIYQTDPSGTMIQYKAKGIGAADEGIQSILNEKYNEVIVNYMQKMSLEDAKKLALNSLKETM
jgi:20S proteasome subunit alpha 5